ncbi:MAG: hypothetical protein LBD49_00385 [Oscillospiraceae bacterium]|jgi:hypothetical protein|nr:hypothetical protein [Oscillospiraceae bacterium]
MDLRKLLLPGFAYIPPRSFELPASVKLTLDGAGADEILFPVGEDNSFYSAKIADTIYFISRAAEGGERRDYAIDTSSGLVTRVSGGTDGAKFDFGVIEGAAAAERHALTRDLDGNRVKWTFGPGAEDSMTAEYSGGGVAITYHNGSVKSPKAFAAARVAEGVYLCCEAFGEYRVTKLCDFGKDLAVGSVFDGKGASFFGGWGKILQI